jgi:hypothetical protein
MSIRAQHVLKQRSGSTQQGLKQRSGSTQHVLKQRSGSTQQLRSIIFAIATCAMCAGPMEPALAQMTVALEYDIVYVRAPRLGDQADLPVPEVFNAVQGVPGTDLMLRRANGQEEVLFAGANGAVMDPSVSFDGRTVFFSYCPDLRPSALNSQRNNAPIAGWDIYKIDVASRVVTRLTNQEWRPPTGAVVWSSNHLSAQPANTYYQGYGVFNTGPYPLPGGRLVFTSNRDGYLPNKAFAFPNLRLYAMDQDGRNVEAIGPMNIGSALHPTVLKDGRVMFASWEAEAARDPRVWGLWAIRPDGTAWEPLFSAFNLAVALHFQTQLSDDRIAVVDYYNLNNWGFGTLLAFEPGARSNGALHGSSFPNHASNPDVRRGVWWFQPGHPSHKQPRFKNYRFSPTNLTALTAFTHGEDDAASYDPDSSEQSPVFAGKVSHPSGAPQNSVLLSYSSGPVNKLMRPVNRPVLDAGIYQLPNGQALTNHKQLRRIVDSPNYNEMMPRALVSYPMIYGVAEPVNLPRLKNQGGLHAALPAASAFGLVGTSTFYRRDTRPAPFSDMLNVWEGYDPFNTAQNEVNPNWFTQGADAGKYANSDIHAVRIIAMEGVANKSYGPLSAVIGFNQHGEHERYRILGEIPLRKTTNGQPVLDPDGNPDTSFVAKIPADVSFSFQTLDRDGLVLNFAQTWHQVRPGEQRTDCGGCHAHAQAPLSFAQTAAGRGESALVELGRMTPLLSKNASGETIVRTVNARSVSVEFNRDIKPILERSCATSGCHAGSSPAAQLKLDDWTITDGLYGSYRRLAIDQNAQYGYKPVIANQTWRQTNASRYVRMFQARRSLLMWKLFGRRLDGWTNAQFPTESIPGVASTLPAGANANHADLDYTGTAMPPPNSGVPALTEDEKMLFARWIDLGAPSNRVEPEQAELGWDHDEQKPTLTLAWPEPGRNSVINEFRLGAYDLGSGLDWATLSVKASTAINAQPAGTELAALFVGDQEIRRLVLTQSLPRETPIELTILIKDVQGNQQEIVRRFVLSDPGLLLRDGFE